MRHYINTSKGRLYYKPVTLYLGIKQINREVAFQNLKVVAKVLEQHHLKVRPAFGSMLGIVRDHDFIEWDEDIDLCLLDAEEEEFKSALWDLKDNGFNLIRYERLGLYSIMRNGEYIDFYISDKISPDVYFEGGAFTLSKHLENDQEWDFKGIKVYIPKDYDEYLTFQYGDWRTPVKYADFNMSSFKKFGVKSVHVIKGLLPDFLYYPLLHRHHRPDLKKFLGKCEAKGITVDRSKIKY